MFTFQVVKSNYEEGRSINKLAFTVVDRKGEQEGDEKGKKKELKGKEVLKEREKQLNNCFRLSIEVTFT